MLTFRRFQTRLVDSVQFESKCLPIVHISGAAWCSLSALFFLFSRDVETAINAKSEFVKVADSFDNDCITSVDQVGINQCANHHC